MNKTELTEYISKEANISKLEASRAIDSFIGAIKFSLKKNEPVTLIGFGTFCVAKRSERSGRNPRTGEVIKIESAKIPKFRPGKSMKEVLNNIPD